MITECTLLLRVPCEVVLHRNARARLLRNAIDSDVLVFDLFIQHAKRLRPLVQVRRTRHVFVLVLVCADKRIR